MRIVRFLLHNLHLVGMLLLSAYGLMWYAQQLALVHDSRQWPPVAGTIIRSEITTSGTYRSRTWPRIRYQDNVGGQTYTNSTIVFGQASSGHNIDAQAAVQRYPLGAQVSVFINPTDPTIACLEPGHAVGGTHLAVPVFGLMIALALLDLWFRWYVAYRLTT